MFAYILFTMSYIVLTFAYMCFHAVHFLFTFAYTLLGCAYMLLTFDHICLHLLMFAYMSRGLNLIIGGRGVV